MELTYGNVTVMVGLVLSFIFCIAAISVDSMVEIENENVRLGYFSRRVKSDKNDECIFHVLSGGNCSRDVHLCRLFRMISILVVLLLVGSIICYLYGYSKTYVITMTLNLIFLSIIWMAPGIVTHTGCGKLTTLGASSILYAIQTWIMFFTFMLSVMIFEVFEL